MQLLVIIIRWRILGRRKQGGQRLTINFEFLNTYGNYKKYVLYIFSNIYGENML